MRNIRKSSTLESKFPLLAVEQGCIISKDADITVAYEVTLPEIFTVTSQEYESVHAAWCKAIKVAARLQHCPQAGLVRERELCAGLAE